MIRFPMSMKLSDFLKARLTAKSSQASLARKVGVSASTVTHWMQDSVPDFYSCLKIALAMKQDPVSIFQMAGHNDWAQLYQASLAISKVGGLLGSNQFIIGTMDDPEKYHEKLQTIIGRENKDSEAIKRMIDVLHRSMIEAGEGGEYLEPVRKKKLL